MFKRSSKTPTKDTSWQGVAKQYHKIVGHEGHYYHQQIVLPNLKKHLSLPPQTKVLDLACGQGVLSHHMPKDIVYVGVDLSESLIQFAEQNKVKRSPHHSTFIHADITKKLPLSNQVFDLATIILAIQNVKYPDRVFVNVSNHLKKDGELIMVMNHPCFRIPRQSAWGIDEKSKLQYRRINRYLSPMEIPIEMNPGRQQRTSKQLTYSYHFPLTYYFEQLSKNNFVVTALEEWTSNKHSEGKMKKMEDRARSEFPLFLMIKATKV